MNNENTNKKYINLPPFKGWVLENFPFIEEDFDAITNYQMMCKIIGYLNVVIKNNDYIQNEEIKPLYVAFNELKNYVDNYFENLDVQEEVNNKLDEMAESGELETIIAQYLRLNALFVYNTLSDLSLAENLQDGSSAYILGETEYNDGKGAFYKIREIRITDVIDGYNIVAITNTEDLIAERLPNFYLNNINNSLDNLETRVETLENEPLIKNNIFIGTFFDQPTEKIKFVTSLDGQNFSDILPNVDLSGRDPQIVYDETRKKFYISCTWGSNTVDSDFTMYITEDFETFETKHINLGILHDRRWAPELFIDTDGTMYAFISVGTTDSDMVIYKSVCTDIDNMIFSPASQVTLDGDSYIDANITKKDDVYYMVVKNETTAKEEIFSSVNMTYWNKINSDILKTGEPCEGGMMTIVNDTFTFYGDTWQSFGYYISAQSKDPTSFTAFKRPNSLIGKRHGTVLYLDDQDAVKLITSLSSYTNNKNVKRTTTREFEISGNIDTLVVYPNFIYRITDTATIGKIINAYNLEEFKFYFACAVSRTLTVNKIINSEFQEKTINLVIYNSNGTNEKLNSISLIGNPRIEENPNIGDLDISHIVANSGWTISVWAFKRIGNMIHIDADCKRTSGTSATMFTMDAGYRPQYHVLSNTNSAGIGIQFRPNGNCDMIGSVTDNRNYFISFEYLSMR